MNMAIGFYNQSGAQAFELVIPLIDAILAHPTFSMVATVKLMSLPSEVNIINELREWPDESMMIKLLTHEQMTDQLLSEADEQHGPNPYCFPFGLLHQVVTMSYALPVFKQLVKIAAFRNQVGIT